MVATIIELLLPLKTDQAATQLIMEYLNLENFRETRGQYDSNRINNN
jgi:hypothetical protein